MSDTKVKNMSDDSSNNKTETNKSYTSELNAQGILTVSIDVPNESMNVFNQQVSDDFAELTQEIDQNRDIKAVIFISAKASGFIAGADIKMLDGVETAAQASAISTNAHRLLGGIANSRKPHIAAIDGVCLGAGYELALACHYRIASDNRATKIGLPEVMIGVLPGGMGNTKLPRLINLPAALDMLLSGKQLDSKRAKRLGLVDEVVSNKVLQQVAETAATRLIKKGLPERKLTLKDKVFTLPFIKDFVIKRAREQVLKKTNGLYPAPLAILDVVQQGISLPLKEALAIEAKKFGELTVSPEAQQLRKLYFATTSLKKEHFMSDAAAKKIVPQKVSKIGILGGGLMGAGIATVSIDKAGVSVRIKDIRDEGLMSAHAYVNNFYKARVKKRILSKEAAQKKINRLTSSLNYSGFKDSDLIIEAVFEDLKLKHKMLSDCEALDNESMIFASNTSSIPISDIAAKAKRPENVLGMHYFSPVEKMPLLEIIKHKGTSDQALSSAVDFGRKQGKTVIVVNDGAGFYVNRILAPYINAALELAMDGVALDKIDEALTHFGFPVGPIKLLDEVGIDIGSKIQAILEDAFGDRMASIGVQQKLIDNKRLGKKVRKGFYRYDEPKFAKNIDESVYTDLGITKKTEMSSELIVERCVYRMLNEAALCLDEGVIFSARDGDIGAIFGIGFPPFLGGPFQYMDTLGTVNVVNKLKEMELTQGQKYHPAPVLVTMAEANQTFYSS
jgi:3-hydroxyacyl-CoA dehydrogenase/enoyl-CoA hydratase/3-hydroxybutyryl-CoA epimerase